MQHIEQNIMYQTLKMPGDSSLAHCKQTPFYTSSKSLDSLLQLQHVPVKAEQMKKKQVLRFV